MSGKRLLKSVLAQTGSLNRLQEEREMWRLRELEKRGHWREFRDREQAPRGLLTRGRLLSDTLSSSPPHSSLHRSRRHERCEHSSPDDHDHREERYWTRRLLKQEESDPTRWGHSGYKELYAEEFATSDETESEPETRKKHKKHENGHPALKKTLKKKKAEVRRKRKRSVSESSRDERERSKQRKKKKLKSGAKKKIKDRRKKRKNEST